MKKFFSGIGTFLKKFFCEILGFLVAVIAVLTVVLFGVLTIFLVAVALFPFGLACGTGFLVAAIINALSELSN